jgi:membrane-associated phospholipid phosphatase
VIARPPLAVPVVALSAFAVLLALVIGGPAFGHPDASISEGLRTYGAARPHLVVVLRVITDVAATIPFLAVGLVATLIYVAVRQWTPATLCAAVTAVIPALWGLMHLLLYHPRPRDGFVVVHGNGFPSGHTANATAAALTALLLLWPRVGRAGRAAGLVAAVAFALFVGVTRIALLVHWPSDVLGGWLLGLAVVPLTAVLVARVSARVSALR